MIEQGSVLNFADIRLQDFGGETVTIKISGKRFCEIHNRTAGEITYAVSSGQRINPLNMAEFAHFLSNTLKPNLMDVVLKEVLTPRQYQKALAANKNGKTIKSVPAQRVILTAK